MLQALQVPAQAIASWLLMNKKTRTKFRAPAWKSSVLVAAFGNIDEYFFFFLQRLSRGLRRRTQRVHPTHPVLLSPWEGWSQQQPTCLLCPPRSQLTASLLLEGSGHRVWDTETQPTAWLRRCAFNWSWWEYDCPTQRSYRAGQSPASSCACLLTPAMTGPSRGPCSEPLVPAHRQPLSESGLACSQKCGRSLTFVFGGKKNKIWNYKAS